MAAFFIGQKGVKSLKGVKAYGNKFDLSDRNSKGTYLVRNRLMSMQFMGTNVDTSAEKVF